MINRVTLIGRLGKDPVLKHFSNDNSVAEFSLATSESYKDKEGNWKEITEWHNIKMPNKFLAERAEKQLKKGSQIYIEGKIRSREYEKDGMKHKVVEVVVETFRSLDRKESSGDVSGGNAGAKPPPLNEEKTSSNNKVDDDLPF